LVYECPVADFGVCVVEFTGSATPLLLINMWESVILYKPLRVRNSYTSQYASPYKIEFSFEDKPEVFI
jgi:hypothetical protein